MRTFFVIKIFLYDLRIELLYEKLCILRHTLIFKKFQNIAKKITLVFFI